MQAINPRGTLEVSEEALYFALACFRKVLICYVAHVILNLALKLLYKK